MAKRLKQEAPGTRGKPKSRIPDFETIEEAAEFWDTHSLAEFEDELEEVTDIMFIKAGPKKAVTVRLDEPTFAAVSREAAEKGVRPSTLIHWWVLERVRGISPRES